MTTRRRFLVSAATLGVSASASWFGYRHLNRLPFVRVNKVGLPLGHLLRDKQLSKHPQSHHRCKTLILGSGAAALSAAWYLSKHGYRNFLVAEGFEYNGNAAAFDAGGGLSAPTGAHYLALPSAESIYVREMLSDFGIINGTDALGNPIYRDTDLVHAPAERVLYGQRWQDGLLLSDRDSRRFLAYVSVLKHLHGADGRKVFAIPIALSSTDETWRRLDNITFDQWLDKARFTSPKLRWYLDYCCRDDYGQGSAQVSAFAGLHYFAARGNDTESVLTWSDGLNHLAKCLRRHGDVQNLAHFPEQQHWQFSKPVSCPASALSVREHEQGIHTVLRHNVSGKTVLVESEYVICAMPLMVACRVVQNPQRYGLNTSLPEYAPWLVSNFVLNRFPKEQAHTELAWDNVVYGSPDLGYVVATHQYIRAAKPERTIFTAYTALNHAPPAQVRQSLLSADAQALLEPAARDLLTVYGKHFWRYVDNVDITVRAHAMSVPKIGYLSRPDLLSLRQHRSRLLFAHSDLSGYSVFEEAVYWGVAAAKQILQ